ncbi:aminopeptidase N [Amylibacter kogurei]|uniref:Aminopeptidase N n=1 Tax=Paramylibacter kogurei TaxID=1889778 RepID=A0A2G5K3W6_9RHOB|nr:aminopeptidase N [Amylibacter kogurei]PIB24236.1 aminopeptidase N [Amylibacter kogurei]
MRPTQAPTIRLSDYQEPAFWVDTVKLSFDLDPTATRVTSKITFRANETRADGPHDLKLDGRNLKLITASINGNAIPADAILQDAEGLTIPSDLVPQDGFVWVAEVEINPSANTALEGLYMSNGMYCTQCEAQGFRKITFYPDRPDVMATFDVEIKGDAPVLLSNGNKLAHGIWHDPWPKPAYLFALVAGDLKSYDDTFTTASGRHVDLQIFVRDGDQDKCAYAMDALKRSMKWDEEVYGREYDLDLFMIVAVDDFNMGAMENKGLNIFNSKYVLASPETATDVDFERIEGIIAHEYFHNWTGNRITCRDWFQLCLKEGLTVFRDQTFTGDMRSHGVKRIDDVLQLRGRQFREDAGPLAHPVRPEEYIEINNFYTATVYEKGAEVIGMLKLLVGDENYRKALDLYFDRHDGQACTIEHWIAVFEDATGRDLAQFKRWYSQAGTPIVKVREEFANGRYTLHLSQSTPPTPGQPDKLPLVIPVRVGLLAGDGSEAAPKQLLELTQSEQSFDLGAFDEKPVPSILRGFSAPVILKHDVDNATRAFLLAHDSDPFNKWEAGSAYASDMLVDMALNDGAIDAAYLDAIHAVALDDTLDPAFRAFAVGLPSEEEITSAIVALGEKPDPDAIYGARNALSLAMAQKMADDLPNLYTAMQVDGPYSPDAEAAGKRALASTALGLLTKLDGGKTAAKQFDNADNMTLQISALAALIRAGAGETQSAAFYDQWKSDNIVLDKWFAIQASCATPDAGLDIVQQLATHPDFNWKNPNRFRSLIGPFAMNPAAFHRIDGKGYQFLADWLIKLDAINPQTTARMAGLFETWKRYDKKRQTLITGQLRRIADTKNLSKDTSEIVGKILG